MLTLPLLQFLFAAAPMRASAPFLRGRLCGEYAALIYKLTEHAVLTAFIVGTVAGSSYGPTGYLWTATLPRMLLIILLQVLRVLLAAAMCLLTKRLTRTRVAPCPAPEASPGSAQQPSPPAAPTQQNLEEEQNLGDEQALEEEQTLQIPRAQGSRSDTHTAWES